MKALDTRALPPEAWRPVEPAAGRSSNRVSEREFEKIQVSLAWSNGSEYPVKLWDFSMHGFAVLLKPDRNGKVIPQVGSAARLKIDLGTGPLYSDCLIKNVSGFKGLTRIGLARRDLARRSKDYGEVGVPEGEFIRIPESLAVRAEAENPIFFGETAPLILVGAKPGFRLEFLCRDPALPLFLGQTLRLGLVLPSSGTTTFTGRIHSLEFAPGAALKARLEPLTVDPGLANDLSELLAGEAGILPETLRRFGFPTRIFRNRVSFRFVESMAEYAEVLALRRNAYVDSGKRPLDTAPEDMSISWDKSSRILCAYHEGVLVASAAMTFPESEDTPLRSETAFPGNRFPGNPPSKRETLEFNSLCTHKDYRKGDLLRALFEQMARIFILSDRKYVMNLADDNLLPMYMGIGFKDQHETGRFLGIPHHLIKGSRETVLGAKGMGWLRWNLCYGDVMRDLVSKGMVSLDWTGRIRLGILLAFGPLANHLYRKGAESSFVRKLRDERKDTENG